MTAQTAQRLVLLLAAAALIVPLAIAFLSPDGRGVEGVLLTLGAFCLLWAGIARHRQAGEGTDQAVSGAIFLLSALIVAVGAPNGHHVQIALFAVGGLL